MRNMINNIHELEKYSLNLITCSHWRHFLKIESKSIYNLLSYVAIKRTNPGKNINWSVQVKKDGGGDDPSITAFFGCDTKHDRGRPQQTIRSPEMIIRALIGLSEETGS